MKQFYESIARLGPIQKNLILIVSVSHTLVGLGYSYMPLVFFRPQFYCNG